MCLRGVLDLLGMCVGCGGVLDSVGDVFKGGH